MKTKQVDGNNLIEVYNTINEVKTQQKKNIEPYLVEALSFRMRGHEEASGTKYYPKGLQEAWAKKDPIDNFESFLIKENILSSKQIDDIRENFKKEINKEWKRAESAPALEPNLTTELNDIFKPFSPKLENFSPDSKTKKLRLIDAIREGLWQSMEKYNESVIMGQDIAKYGGVFKVTEGFYEKFGEDRVRNTPLCESAIVGAALGLSLKGKKSNNGNAIC
jgi:2-oxoisovalerate dehydrogenase E1 component